MSEIDFVGMEHEQIVEYAMNAEAKIAELEITILGLRESLSSTEFARDEAKKESDKYYERYDKESDRRRALETKLSAISGTMRIIADGLQNF